MIRYVFLLTQPSINLVKQRSIDDMLCDLFQLFFCLYLIRIIPKNKLKTALLKRINGSTQGELNFCEGEALQRGESKNKGNWLVNVCNSGNTLFAKT